MKPPGWEDGAKAGDTAKGRMDEASSQGKRQAHPKGWQPKELGQYQLSGKPC